MTVLVAQAQASIPNGAFSFGPAAVPAGTVLSLTLTRCTTATPTVWPNASTTVDVQLQFSYDGGVTYSPNYGFSSAGGISKDKVGADIGTLVAKWPLPGTPTHVKGTGTVSGGPLVTAVTVSVT